MSKSKVPTPTEVLNALDRSYGKQASAKVEKCTNKFACRCAKCKALNETLQASMRQIGAGLQVIAKGKRPKGSIYKGMPAPVTPPKQVKSLPGQLSLFD